MASSPLMSLDGFIADPNDQVGELFDWYSAGNVSVPSSNEGVSFDLDDASAEMLRELIGNTGREARHLEGAEIPQLVRPRR